LLVAWAGGAAGAMLAIGIAQILVTHAPGAEAILPDGHVPVDSMVFLFAFGVALAAGIAVGIFPAIRASRADLANGLKDSARSTTTSRLHGRFRNVLVMAEVGLSLVLLIAAGLLMRSFSRLYEVQPGVRLDHVLSMNIALPAGS